MTCKGACHLIPVPARRPSPEPTSLDIKPIRTIFGSPPLSLNLSNRAPSATARRTPAEEGKEGPPFPVLIHLDIVKDYTPISPGRDEHARWPRTYRFKDKWRFGTKDGEDRARSVGSCSTHLAGRRSDDDEGGGGGSSRRRGTRGGARKRFFQNMREQAMCRDTVRREPEPRRHRRHTSTTADACPVGAAAPADL